MKKILFFITCMLVISLTTFAQRGNNHRTPEENAKQMTERMKTELNLTPGQVAPVDSINLAFTKERAKLRENAKGDSASMRDDMKKLHDSRLEALKKILTNEQLQTYKKLMDERMQKRGSRGRGK